MKLGGRIGARLAALGWKQRNLLDALPDLSPQALSNLIKRDSARSEWDVQIAAALGVTVAWLVYGEESADKDAGESIVMPEATPPADDRNGLYAIEQRTIARPPLTVEEYDVLDGYRVASESLKVDIRGKCLVALTDHERREGGRQKKA